MSKDDLKKLNKKTFIIPGIILLLGFLTMAIFKDQNSLFYTGLLLLCLGTLLTFFTLYKETERLGIEMPFVLYFIFPHYPVVEDYDDLTRNLTEFRSVYGSFMSDVHRQENSVMQNHATQLLWHSFDLQKKRMLKYQIQIQLNSRRRAYSNNVYPSKNTNGVRSDFYFDGRYNVNEVYEEIESTRTFFHKGKKILNLFDKDVAHYTFLSAKKSGTDYVICPNCGNAASRNNLLDGCDFCGTKFTIEDLNNRVGSFGFRRDFKTSESKREVVTTLIYPWVFFLIMLPIIYFSFFGALVFVSEENGILAGIATGIFATALLGLLGFIIVKIAMILITPAVFLFSKIWEDRNRKLIYRPDEEVKKEKEMKELVRKSDPLFSIQSFFGNIQNKLYSVHFADTKEQVNAFTDTNIAGYLKTYEKVVDIETLSLSMDSYHIKDGFQIATVTASLMLRKFDNSKIKEQRETVKLRLKKSEDCKTQAVCGPSVLKCGGCGNSLLLMQGKKCEYCGTELDMKQYDWVISEYIITK